MLHDIIAELVDRGRLVMAFDLKTGENLHEQMAADRWSSNHPGKEGEWRCCLD